MAEPSVKQHAQDQTPSTGEDRFTRLKGQQKFEMTVKKFLDFLDRGILNLDQETVRANQDRLERVADHLQQPDLVEDDGLRFLRNRVSRAAHEYQARVERAREEQQEEFAEALRQIQTLNYAHAKREVLAIGSILQPEHAPKLPDELPKDASVIERLAFKQVRGGVRLSGEQIKEIRDTFMRGFAEYKHLKQEVKETEDELRPLKEKLRGRR